MPITAIVVLGGLLIVAACSSSPTDIDESRESVGGPTVVSHGGTPQNDPCGSGGVLAVRCVRRQ
jgi:hypothetical protein